MFKTALIVLFSLSTLISYSQDPEPHAQGHAEYEEEFNPGDMIMHHVSDAHEVHFFGDVALYLPVMLFDDDGFHMFSSSHFYHNEKSVEVDGRHQHYYVYDKYVMFHEKIYLQGYTGLLYDKKTGEVHNTVSKKDINASNVGQQGEAKELVWEEKGEEKKLEYFEGEDWYFVNGTVYNKSMEGLVLMGKNAANVAVFDISVTKSIVGMFLAMIICVVLFGGAARKYKKNPKSAPSGLQSWLEPLIVFIRDEVAIPSMGEGKADRYMPFLLTTFFFIWICNLLGLIPFIGGFNVTGTLSITIVMAIVVFVMTTISGNKHYWGHIFWPPGVPLPIKFILVPIEFLQVFIKPAVLMIRLTANITAGHIIMLAFVSLIFIFAKMGGTGAGIGVGIGSTAFMIFMYFIELLVTFLQAYVFTLLAALYFGQATEEAHH